MIIAHHVLLVIFVVVMAILGWRSGGRS